MPNIWSAANGGLRDGGLSKSEDIGGKRPFSSVFWIIPSALRTLWKRANWKTGVPDHGNEWRKFRAVPRLYPLRSLVLHFVSIGVETEGLLDYQRRAGIISIVRWNLRPVIFGAEISSAPPVLLSLAPQSTW